MNSDTQPLLKPLRLGDLDLRNRVIMSPLTRTRARNAQHVPTDLMLEYYKQRASAGLIFTEGTFVSDDSQGWYGVPGIYTEKQRKGWERITNAVHEEGGKIFVQLWHTGGASRPDLRDGLPALAPSALDLGQQVHTVKGIERAGKIEKCRLAISKIQLVILLMPLAQLKMRALTASSCKQAMYMYSNNSCMI
jgi:N-ethylmaleimide reductase